MAPIAPMAPTRAWAAAFWLMEALSDAGRSGIGGASMEATDDAGDKGAADEEAGEEGMLTAERGRVSM